MTRAGRIIANHPGRHRRPEPARTGRLTGAVVTAVGAALVAVSLGGPLAAPPVPTSQDGEEVRVPVRGAAWVAADGAGGTGGPLWAGDRNGGAVVYLLVDLPEPDPGAPGAPVRLDLTSAGEPLPELVELVAVPDASWRPEQLRWENAPVLGRAVHAVRPAPDDRRVTFDLAGAVAGPGRYAFAVTVPPDRGAAGFVSLDGSADQPTLRLPAAPPAPPSYGPSATPTGSPTDAPTSRPSATPTAAPTAAPTSRPSATPTAAPTGTEAAAESYLAPSTPATTPTPSAGPTGPPAEPPECVLGERLVPSCGVLWGVAPSGHTGAPRTESLAEFEAATGRRQDIYHAYHRGQAMFPTREEVAIAAQGRLLFLNWKPQRWSWAQIAGGDPSADAYLDRLATHIKDTYQEPFFLTVHHEPENNVRPWPGSGMQATDYAAMFRYVVERLRASGVENLVSVLTHMAYVPWNTRPWFPDLYPGDDVVDWVAWDSYAYSDPGYGHGDFGELMNRRSAMHPDWPGFYAWATEQFPDKPFMLSEWGVWHSPRNPGHMARLYDSVARQTPLFPRVKAMVYFDTPGDQRDRDSRPTRTGDGLAAYQRLGAERYFQVRLGPEAPGDGAEAGR